MAAEPQFAALPVSMTVNGVKHDALVEPRTLDVARSDFKNNDAYGFGVRVAYQF